MRDSETPTLLLYTSGTTGQPKGALLPQRKALYNCRNAELPAPGSPLDGEALLAWGRERLAGFELPREFVAVRELPRTETGEIQKHRLPRCEASRRRVQSARRARGGAVRRAAVDRERAVRSVVDGSAWEEFCDALRRAGGAVIAAAPDDALDRAEGLRYVGRLATHALRTFLEESDPAHPKIAASTPKIGGDNPDFVYTNCAISGRYEYRLRGRRNDAHRIGFGAYHGALGTAGGLQASGYRSDGDLVFAPDGSFELLLSATPKPGNWLPMRPETSQLTIRQLLLDRARERPASFEIERLGEGAPPPPLDPAVYAAQLARARGFVDGVVTQFLAWTRAFAARPNEIFPVPPELAAAARGDPSTIYYNGYFALGPDEALAVDLDPPRCEYWNLQVCNHWLESLDFLHYTTSLNHRSAVAGADGRVRAVIAARDPGVPNWIDSAGHARGCLALRWIGADRDSQPRTRVVKLPELTVERGA